MPPKKKPDETPESMDWFKDRIQELRRVPANQLYAHPRNWRRHPPDQKSAMHGLLSTLGYVNAILVREVEPNRYEVLDGHMRAELSEGAEHVPVLVADLDDSEADLVVATFDTIGDFALQEADMADELAREVWTEDESVNTILRDLLENETMSQLKDSKKLDRTDNSHPLALQPYEHYDYVVVLARNHIDYARLVEIFDLEKQDFSVPGGAKKIGLGRCIDASVLIDLLERQHVMSGRH